MRALYKVSNSVSLVNNWFIVTIPTFTRICIANPIFILKMPSGKDKRSVEIDHITCKTR